VRRLAAALLLVAAWAPAAWAQDAIRVAVIEDARSVELSGALIQIVAFGGGSPWRASVVRAVPAGQGVEIAGRRAAGFRLSSRGPLRLNGHEYPGALDILRSGAGLVVVNEVPLEEYVASVLRAEVSERWPTQALRAQAIVIRTYAAHARQAAAGRAYHVVASTQHQLYGGAVPASSPAWAAAQDTRGQVLLWEGALFPAFYHADSGGFTEDAGAVFVGGALPALRPVVDHLATDSPYASWIVEVPTAVLSEALRQGGVDVGSVTAVQVSERTTALRAASVTVRGTRGAVRLRGSDFRRIVGYDTLRSTLFAVVVRDGVARFAGRGYGHGVGLCQWCAKAMAERGFTADQILAFYYRGATLALLPPR